MMPVGDPTHCELQALLDEKDSKLAMLERQLAHSAAIKAVLPPANAR
jgi:hypothetical protein